MRIATLPAIVISTMVLTSAIQAHAETFCERLAPKLHLTKVQKQANDKDPMVDWDVNLLGLGKVLFGGSTVATFGASMPSTCDTVKKGIVCQVQGRSTVRVGTKYGKVEEEALDGEKATLLMKGATIHCMEQPVVSPGAAETSGPSHTTS